MGLCEFKRQHLDVAQEWFIKASMSSSKNKEVQGKATAMLGIISENKGDYTAAEIAFGKAAIDLHGLDRLEATRRSSSSTQIVSSDTYSLQFGAYKEKANANTAIAQLSPILIKAGINSIWITEETDRTGRSLYLVQAGHFLSRSAASNRRKQGDLPQCIVTVTD